MQQKKMALNQTNTSIEDIETMISSHYDKIFKYCYSILRNVEDAEDAVQEVFLKVIINGK